MKKIIIILFLLTPLISLSQSQKIIPIPSFPKIKNIADLTISYETFNMQNNVWLSDFYLRVSPRLGFRNKMQYQSKLQIEGSASFYARINYLDYRFTKRLTGSIGRQRIKNYTFNFEIKTTNLKFSYKVF